MEKEGWLEVCSGKSSKSEKRWCVLEKGTLELCAKPFGKVKTQLKLNEWVVRAPSKSPAGRTHFVLLDSDPAAGSKAAPVSLVTPVLAEANEWCIALRSWPTATATGGDSNDPVQEPVSAVVNRVRQGSVSVSNKGWLKKKGKLRFFLLDAGTLFWATKETNASLPSFRKDISGSLLLSGCDVSLLDDADHRDEKTFEVTSASGSNYVLTAATKTEARSWVRTIRSIVQQFGPEEAEFSSGLAAEDQLFDDQDGGSPPRISATMQPVSALVATSLSSSDSGKSGDDGSKPDVAKRTRRQLPQRRGVLTKKGQKRWVRLKCAMFSWYGSEDESEPRGVLSMYKSTVNPVGEDAGFRITTDGVTVYEFSHRSPYEIAAWMSALQAARAWCDLHPRNDDGHSFRSVGALDEPAGQPGNKARHLANGGTSGSGIGMRGTDDSYNKQAFVRVRKQNRFLVLRGNILLWFDREQGSDDNSNCKQSVQLVGCDVAVDDDDPCTVLITERGGLGGSASGQSTPSAGGSMRRNSDSPRVEPIDEEGSGGSSSVASGGSARFAQAQLSMGTIAGTQRRRRRNSLSFSSGVKTHPVTFSDSETARSWAMALAAAVSRANADELAHMQALGASLVADAGGNSATGGGGSGGGVVTRARRHSFVLRRANSNVAMPSLRQVVMLGDEGDGPALGGSGGGETGAGSNRSARSSSTGAAPVGLANAAGPGVLGDSATGGVQSAMNHALSSSGTMDGSSETSSDDDVGGGGGGGGGVAPPAITLLHRGTMTKTKKSRYFVLTQTLLAWYTSREVAESGQEEPRNMMRLQGARMLPYASGSTSLVVVEAGGQRREFACSTAREAADWAKALEKALLVANRSIQPKRVFGVPLVDAWNRQLAKRRRRQLSRQNSAVQEENLDRTQHPHGQAVSSTGQNIMGMPDSSAAATAGRFNAHSPPKPLPPAPNDDGPGSGGANEKTAGTPGQQQETPYGLLADFEIPVLDRTIEWLEDRAGDGNVSADDPPPRFVEGLFRLSGELLAIERYKDMFDRGMRVTFPPGVSPHCVSGVLKLWLRSLPDPPIPLGCRAHFMAAGNDPVELRKLVSTKLHPSHFCLLNRLFHFIHRLSKHSERTKMTNDNLSIVFGPTIMKGEPSEDKLAELRETPKILVVTRCLIENTEDIFGPPT